MDGFRPERLRAIRLAHGLGQEDLSARSGVAQNTISEAETGRRTPRPSTLRKFAAAMGVEVGDFFEAADSPKAVTPPEPDYAARLEELGFPPHQIEAWRTQNERDQEFIKRELEKMSAKDLLEQLFRSPGERRMRDYYRNADKETRTPPESESA